MISVLKNLVLTILVAITLQSCDSNPSLQSYYVDNQEQPNFLSIDVPVHMLNLEMAQLNPEQQEAYKSIQKLNMLAYKVKADNQSEYETELNKVKSILDNPQYEELMRGGNPEDGSFSIKILGADDDVKEFILFGNANDKGFAIVRILGKDMSPNKIMSLASALDKAQIDDSKISQITEFFK